MTFENFQEFNQYLGVAMPISEKIDFGIYHNGLDLKLKSEAINVDFYRISLKENFFHTNNQKQFQNKSVLFFNSPNQNFEWDLKEKWDGFYIQISREVIEKHRFLFRNYLEYGLHEALVLEQEEAEEIKQIFNLLHSYYIQEKHNFEIVLSYVNLIICLVEKQYEIQFLNNKKQYNHLVSQFQLLLENYYQNPEQQLLSVRTIAKKMNVSPNYLGDIIKLYTQKSASEHIQEKIIEKAKELLKETKLSVSEIAFFLGYEYPNYFAKFFKKHFGISPKEFRNA